MKISLFVYFPKITLEAKTENKNFLKIPERFTTFKSVWQKYQKIFLLNKNSLLKAFDLLINITNSSNRVALMEIMMVLQVKVAISRLTVRDAFVY